MSWPSIAFGELADFLSGNAWSAPKFNSDGRGVPVIRIQNVSTADSTFLYWDEPFDQRFLIVKGDILLTLSGSFRTAVWDGPQALLNQRIVKITPTSRLDQRFLLHFLSRKLVDIERMGRHALVNNVSLADLKAMLIPLPPLDEQRRIASLLDQAEELRAKRRAAIALLDQLPQAIFLEMFGDPATNPMGWPIAQIGDLLSSANYGTSGKAGTTGKWPVLRMGNITSAGHLDLNELKYMDLTEAEIPKYTARKGDVLFNRTNSADLVGKTALYTHDEPVAFAGYLVRLRVNEKATPEFVAAFMNLGYTKKVLRSMAKSIVGMANINAKEVQTIALPHPPIELQHKFAERVDAISRAKAAQQTSLTELDALFTSLQAGAFGHKPAKQIHASSRKTEKANRESPSGSSVIDRLIESYRDVNVEALGAARKAIEFPELAGIRLAREELAWSASLSAMLTKQTEMSSLLAAVSSPPRLPAFADAFSNLGAVSGLAKLMEDSLFPSRKLTSLIDSLSVSHLSGMADAVDSIRRLTVANSLDTSVAHMMAGIATHQTAIDAITNGWRNSMWDDIQRSSLMFERLQASSVASSILEVGSMERFNSVRLLRSTTQIQTWENDVEADQAVEIVRLEYLDSVESGLKGIDPRLLKMFQGAKAAAKSGNADRARHVAVSLREMTTHLLHILAPNEAIKSWSTSESDYANGKPTRASRIRFIYSRYGTEVLGFFEGDIKEAIKWIDRINGETHNLDGFESDGAIEALIARFEGIALALIRGAKGFE